LVLLLIASLPPAAQAARPHSPLLGTGNDDDYADLAVGVPGEDDDRGVVHLLYASATGIPDQVGERWWEGIGGLPGTREMWDSFGSALATGDFNGDGHTDLAVGVTGQSVNGHANAGIVQIIYASPTGLISTGNTVFSQDDLFSTAEPNDAFGQVLATGDFNADGYDDLAVGVPSEDYTFGAETEIDAGSVNVIYGSASGLSSDYNRVFDEDDLSSVPEPGDQFGSALAACDFDGDGYDDLAIGVPFEDFNAMGSSVDDIGSVHVLFGSASRLVTAGNQLLMQGQGGLTNAAEESDHFGRSLAAGYFNGDGACDLAIGVPSEEPGTVYTDSGAVHVLYASTSGAAFAPPDSDWLWSRYDTDMPGEIEDYAFFGRSLAAGDFDGDGIDDLAIGTPYDDVGDEADAGSVQVMYGGASGGLSEWGRVWYQGGYINTVAEGGDHFGWSLASGDIDGDGYEDLVIGVPDEHIGSTADAGMVHVFFGADWGIPEHPRYRNLHQDNGSIAGSAEPNDRFGASVAVLRATAPPVYLPLVVRGA
jgi:hypothetical protein